MKSPFSLSKFTFLLGGIILLAACKPQPLAAPEIATGTPTKVPEAWATTRTTIPTEVSVFMPTSLPARFGPPELLEVKKDDQFGWVYSIAYTAQDNGEKEYIVFILNNGKGAWGNSPRPDTTESITVNGVGGNLYYSSSESTSGNPVYVAIWKEQGQHYEMKTSSSQITKDEILQVVASIVPLKR